VSAPVATCG